MISNKHGLLKYLAIMIGSAYILSTGSVYGQTNQTAQTAEDVTGPILAHALDSLKIAKQDYDAGNKTGALDEAHEVIW